MFSWGFWHTPKLRNLRLFFLEGVPPKKFKTFYFIPQKWLILESKVKLEVKTISQELWNEVLYISAAQNIQKSLQNILFHITKVINPRVKSQARGQNNRSTALKWGIVHLCSSITLTFLINGEALIRGEGGNFLKI